MGLIIVKKSGCDYIVRIGGGAILHRCKSPRAAMLKAYEGWKGTGWKIIYLTIAGEQITIDDDYHDKYLRPVKLADRGKVRRSDDLPDHHHHHPADRNTKRQKK